MRGEGLESEYLAPISHCGGFDMQMGDVVGDPDISCPHCPLITGTCHVCRNARRVSFSTGVRALAWVWATPGCSCDACKAAPTPWPEEKAVAPAPQVPAVDPHTGTFRGYFEKRQSLREGTWASL